jgi:AAHS family 3-hydroxyphenylpropionic acid transporter
MTDASDRRPAGLIAMCCLAAAGEGFDLQAPGVTLPVLGPLFHLASPEGAGLWAGFISSRSLFLSASTFGLFFGALIGGRLSDRFSRRGVAAASVALFALFSILTAACQDAQALLWARFATGVGLGGALPNLLAMVSESARPERRNTAMGLLYASLPLGGTLVSLLSFALANPQQWRLIYVAGGLVPLLAVPGLLLLSADGAADRMRAALPAAPVGLALFGEGRGTRTLVLWTAFLGALITQYVLLSWLPSLLIAKGVSRPDAALVQIGFNLLGAAGSIATGALTDRPGRVRAVVVTFAAAIVLLVLMSGAPPAMAAVLPLGALAGWAVMGGQNIVYALAPATYPGPVRGTGVGFAVAAGRIGAAAGPLIAGAILGAGFGPSGVLALIAALMAVAGGAAAWLSLGRPTAAASA